MPAERLLGKVRYVAATIVLGALIYAGLTYVGADAWFDDFLRTAYYHARLTSGN